MDAGLKHECESGACVWYNCILIKVPIFNTNSFTFSPQLPKTTAPVVSLHMTDTRALVVHKVLRSKGKRNGSGSNQVPFSLG